MNTANVIDPTVLRDFLVKAHHWTVLEIALRDGLYVLSHAKYPNRQLVFPVDGTAPDYRQSVDLVFYKLADLTGIPLHTLQQSAHTLHDDVLTLRIHADNQGYTLPLGFVSTLIQSTEKLLQSAACSVLNPTHHHRKLYRKEASKLIEKARFQQTERGSFILKVACPLPTDWDDLVEPEQPFDRKVTLRLQQSVSQLANAIKTDKLTELIDTLSKEARPLISSNLCDALVQMQDEEIQNSLDVGVHWSALYAVPSNVVGLNTACLQPDYFQRIGEVGRALRPRELELEETYVGTVERLGGVMNEQIGNREGEVILSLLSPTEGAFKAKVQLNAQDHAKAIRAYETHGASVEVKGHLTGRGRMRQLTHLSKFELVGIT